MNRTPFQLGDLACVPDEEVTGDVLIALHTEFLRTSSWPYSFGDLLDDWKHRRVLMVGVYETRAIFDHARIDPGWHTRNFAKPGAPWSIFFGLMAVSRDGTPEVGWVSPNVDDKIATWIRKTLDPNAIAPWNVDNF